MPKTITRANVMPLGGYSYVQPETKMIFKGNETFWTQCRLIRAHRSGNGLARATLQAVAEDLVAYTCIRVPGVCSDSKAKTAAPARAARKCGTCGGRKARK